MTSSIAIWAPLVSFELDGVVHRLPWNQDVVPLSAAADPNAMFTEQMVECVPAPFMPKDMHPTDKPVTCLACLIRTEEDY